MERTKCEVFRDIPDTNYQIGCFGNIRNVARSRGFDLNQLPQELLRSAGLTV